MGNTPRGLPGESDKAAVRVQATRESMVHCRACGQKGRTVSNSGGVNVYCNTCKTHWPISSAPLAKEVPLSQPRGLSKVTLVEPDWGIATETIGDVTNDEVGPKGS